MDERQLICSQIPRSGSCSVRNNVGCVVKYFCYPFKFKSSSRKETQVLTTPLA